MKRGHTHFYSQNLKRSSLDTVFQKSQLFLQKLIHYLKWTPLHLSTRLLGEGDGREHSAPSHPSNFQGDIGFLLFLPQIPHSILAIDPHAIKSGPFPYECDNPFLTGLWSESAAVKAGYSSERNASRFGSATILHAGF
jgi:hypothetical protein